MKNRAAFGAALAAIAVILAAWTYSINPLSAPGDSEADARLEGVWQETSGDPRDPAVILYFVVPTDNGLMDVDFVGYEYKKDPGDSSQVEWHRFRVFRTEIDGAQYLNVMPVAGESGGKRKRREEDKPVYFIFKYDISQDGVLTIWHSKDGAVTDTENLREYLRQGNDPFTEHFLTLRKILPKVPGQ